MAVISFSGRVPARKSLESVGLSFSPGYSWFRRSDEDVARASGLTESEVVTILDAVAERRGRCTLGDIKREIEHERILTLVMALVGAGVLSIDGAALAEATASMPVPA